MKIEEKSGDSPKTRPYREKLSEVHVPKTNGYFN